ncbi:MULTISPECIES: glucose 1-dehydrogenase [Thermomonospora]|uniref:Short-chain dehydrogenase/reductase SDR n=1 Tax=Thermomonospora curvata (strain ATCC 19995 / DSM 43183 / JCM 3096 / KCTC 9072 / NBRC 15933 / NCIMB 10081 / Henssen B9) TaxID=471852 RepID=D1AAI2_THECD|nr:MULTISPECIES: glucose 1-dehydrogenase [Thermomonospora]ACY98895.1 short-chain dehydrogenase/reductase SDR [Thermomonospora curvata DSM 43183]PKK13096.1 MAG: 3-oxoacyl-ACP reductase [Thermomonospora sp. CIF 1]
MGLLDGKVAIITGGARGMGKAHVRRFVAEGARVVFGDILEKEGAELAAELGEAVRFVRMDVTSPDDWKNAVETAVGTYGTLNVLVNNAGIIKHKRIEDMSLEECRRILEVNLIGQWLGVKAVIEPMKAAGGGSIVNISSTEGFIGAAGLAAYSASKFGVRGLTKAAARELGQYGIRVNSVHPGGILTPMVMDPDVVAATADSAESFMKALPLNRMGRSREVSGVVAFLASDDSSYCTGSEVLVDGGMLTGAGY